VRKACSRSVQVRRLRSGSVCIGEDGSASFEAARARSPSLRRAEQENQHRRAEPFLRIESRTTASDDPVATSAPCPVHPRGFSAAAYVCPLHFIAEPAGQASLFLRALR